MTLPLTRRDRDLLLHQNAEELARLHVAADRRDVLGLRRHRELARLAELEYWARLPRVTMGVCPFDQNPLTRIFDPFGFDGLWWRPAAEVPDAPACTHFCLLRGAVNFQGTEPVGGEFKARVGPEVPFVIPDVLRLPTMVAVIGQVPMENGCLAYPIAYFADIIPTAKDLAPSWARAIYTWPGGWNYDIKIWDFNLLPWLKEGKLKWCAPDSGNLMLGDGPPESCPYLNLPGEKQQIEVKGQLMMKVGVPDGIPM